MLGKVNAMVTNPRAKLGEAAVADKRALVDHLREAFLLFCFLR